MSWILRDRPRQALLAATLMSAWAAPVHAQPPAEAAQAAAQGAAIPASVIYLVAMGVAMLMLGGVLWQRRRRQRDLHELDGLDELHLAQTSPAAPLAEPDPIVALAQAVAKEQGTSSALAIQAIEDRPMFGTSAEGNPRECPTCHRKYASWMVVCPIDASPLNAPHSRRRAARAARAVTGKTRLDRKRCPSCERRFARDAHFCPLDATSLVIDAAELAADAPTFEVCRQCGHDLEGCECGEAREPMVLDPSALTQRAPGLPLTVCPQCHTYGAFGQVHCPRDGELLIPLSSVQINVFPTTGYGPRRKVCRKCGTRFGGAWVHCPHDGARLTPLH